ncbi:MAG: prepilin-type N-terminal cleavage/methylation domain-containing protein [Thermodesulfobacteriota bacterium]
MQGTGRGNSGGFTLFELLIAIVLLAMVSTMLYSVLHNGIRFSDRGAKKILAVEKSHNLLQLLHQQIISASFDDRSKNVVLSGDGETLKVITSYPLLYRYAGVVLAVYRYDAVDRRLYYAEKRDYYNIDYGEDYLPDFEDMVMLADNLDELTMEVDDDTKTATLGYGDIVMSVTPRCAVPLTIETVQ